MSFLAILCGAIALYAFHLLVRHLTKNQQSKTRSEMLAEYGDQRLHLQSASVSTDLSPLLDRHLAHSDKLTTVGCGDYFLSENHQVWKNGLASCHEKGVQLDYVLVDPSEHSLAAFNEFRKQYGNGFNAFILRASSSDPREVELIEVLRTEHPTIATNKQGEPKLMWIEGYHPLNSKEAFDIDFTPPNKFESPQLKEFEKWSKILNDAKQLSEAH